MAPFRHQLQPFLPFLAHLSFVALTSFVLLYYVNSRHFHTTHHHNQIIQADGSTTPSEYYILQSDIMTIVSILASVARILGAWWATDITWHCIFLFMEKGGLSLQGVERMFGGFPLFPSHWTLGKQLVFLAMLGAIFSSNFLFNSHWINHLETWIHMVSWKQACNKHYVQCHWELIARFPCI